MKVLDWSWSCCCCYFIVSLAARLAAAAPSVGDTESAASSSGRGSSINRRAWPPLKHYDIWSAAAAETDAAEEKGGDFEAKADVDVDNGRGEEDFQFISNSFGDTRAGRDGDGVGREGDSGAKRQSKVIHLFPVPVDGECLSDDGRRVGHCFNAYECRQRGGLAKGECAMGFGVCCIFIANCNETISNNITYLVSPNFPSFMPNNFSACQLKVRMLSADISQLRIDFYHFSLGQPNRRTGVCDGDIFNVSGGAGGTFSLCGQNSGQHIYYDVGGRALPRQTLYGNLRPLTYDQLYPQRNNSTNRGELEQFIEISMQFAQRFLPIRLWEIRIAQIPFSQRAPAGCLQYHTGTEGFLQTFNFAENGRHLANQHYRICMRQETEMCSIMYQPCDEQSFRIGPSGTRFGEPTTSGAVGAGGGGGAAGGGVMMMGGASMTTIPMASADAVTSAATMPLASTSQAGASSAATAAADDASAATQMMATSTTMAGANANSSADQMATTMPSTMTTATSAAATTAAPAASSTTAAAAADEGDGADAEAPPQRSSTPSTLSTSSTALPTSPLSDDVEGSGGDEGSPPVRPSTIRRPRPVGGGGGGGFDILGFLRNAFEFGFRRQRGARQMRQQQRQFYSTCSDRLTMPCIVEDFIGTGFGPLPGCEPVHCGSQFCSSGLWPCRIESTVTPFYIGVNFGDGSGGKGSAEDNIGACLRYMQVTCM